MTPLKRHVKIVKPRYGKPDGYNHTNAIVAFGKPDDSHTPAGKRKIKTENEEL